MKHKEHKSMLSGNIVYVPDGHFESAFRKFKKKIEASGLLRELNERQHYTKPTTRRKQLKNAAKKRWQRQLEKNQLPDKKF